jgi:ribokinase
LLEHGVKNVLITVGAKGAYLFNHETAAHIPVTQVHSGSDEKDETGCGDQTMAALCAFIQEGEPLQHAAEKAILAGTLQFHRIGIQPVSKEELTK